MATVVTLSMASWSLVGCGGSGFSFGNGSSLSPDDQALADAIAKDSELDVDGAFSTAQSQCYGEGLVRQLGADRLNEMGVTVTTPGGPEFGGRLDLTDSEAKTVVGVLDGCLDIGVIITKALATSLPEDAAECITGKLSNDQQKTFLAATLISDTVPADMEATLRSKAAECGVG